jgi:DNA invertase Pin-like site-specific DNA recombinase
MNTKKTDKKRVVAYARVSTDKEEQKTSISHQKTIVREFCKQQHDNYTMSQITVDGLCDKGVYYDIGTSGTKLSRPAFDRMLLDAGLTPIIDADTNKATVKYKQDKKPKFDVILVKDTSRFSRNVAVVDILQELLNNGVVVYFLDKNFNSKNDMSMIEMFLMFAEQESRDRSIKVQKGYEAGVRQGKLYMGGKMIGYDYNAESNSLVINEEEARIVKRVFDMYTVDNYGTMTICNKLADEGIKTHNKAGEEVKYGRSTIQRMLTNEKYCGITNCGRYFTTDLFSSKQYTREYDNELRQSARKAQQEQLAQGIVKIPPIISKEQFDKAQAIMKHNSDIYKLTGEWHGTTDYSKKVVCGCCGAYYRASGRRFYASANKVMSVYVCKHRIVYDEAKGIPKCTNPSIKENQLDEALTSENYYYQRKEAVNELISTGKLYIQILTNALNKDNAVAVSELENEIEQLTVEKNRLLPLYTKGIFTEQELTKQAVEYDNKIQALKSRQEQLKKGNDEIYKDIDEIKNVVSVAEKDLKDTLQIIQNNTDPRGKMYVQGKRRELLREVDKIIIDRNGRAQIQFKTLREMKIAIESMGINIEHYVDLEEKGWENEFADDESLNTSDSADNTPHKTVAELLNEWEKRQE